MWENIKNALSPPHFDDPEKRRQARTVTIILLITIFAVIILAISEFSAGESTSAPILFGVVLLLIGLWFIVKRGNLMVPSVVLPLILLLAILFLAVQSTGTWDVSIYGLFAIIILAGMLLGPTGVVAFTLLSMLAYAGLAYSEMSGWFIHNQSDRSNWPTTIIALVILAGSGSLLYILVGNFLATLAQVRRSEQVLDQRVRARTRDLNTSVEVARRLTTILDKTELVDAVVNQVKTAFNYYHVHIYLLDELGQWLIMTGGTGEAGQNMLAQEHRIMMGRGLVGRAGQTQTPILVPDTGQDPAWLPNPLLPDTRSELALPIMAGSQLLGVLDVQQNVVDGLQQSDVDILEGLANQVAVALRNSDLVETTRQAQQSAEQFKLGIDRSTSAVFLTDTNGKILYVNPAFETVYGYPAAEAIGKTPRILKSGLVSPEQYAYVWQALLNKEVVAGEIINRGKDGRLVYIDASNNPIVNEAGELIGFLSLHTDITERKQTEADLDRRVAELNLFNEVGQRTEQSPTVPEFLDWIVAQIPAVMRHSDDCEAAIMLGDTLYGSPEARQLPRHIVEGLRIGGEIVGRIYLAYRADHNFEDEDSAFIGGLGRRIASYIESRQLIGQIQRQALDLRTVADLGTAFTTTLNPQQLLQEVVDRTKASFHLYHAHIYLFDEVSDDLVLTAGAGDIGEKMVAEQRRIPFSAERSLVARAARTQAGVTINDVRDEQGFLPHALLPDTRSELAVPLIVGDKLLGVLDVQSDEVGHFTPEDVDIQTTLASQIAVALQNARQYEQAQRALTELNALQRTITRQGWQAFLTTQTGAVSGFVANKTGVAPVLEVPGVADRETHNVPLQVRGETIGGLQVRMPSGEALSLENQTILESVSRQVGEALDRARLSEETTQALSRTELLYRTGRAMLSAEELPVLLQSVVDGITDVLNCDRASLITFDREREEVTNFLRSGEDSSKIDIVSYAELEEGLSGWVLRERKAAVSHKGAPDPRESAAIYQRRVDNNSGSIVVVPLQYQNKIYGTMTSIRNLDQPDFVDSDVELMTALANQAAVAMDNRRLLRESQNRATQLATVNELAQAVSQQLELNSLLRTVFDQIKRVLKIDAFIVGLYDAENQTVSYPIIREGEYESRQEARPLTPGSFTERVITSGQPELKLYTEAEVVEQQNSAGTLGDTEAEFTASVLFVPLQIAGDTIGVMSVNTYDYNAYTEDDVELISSIANFVSVALENARLFAATEERAAQLTRLAEIEADLSTAEDEAAIISALGQFAQYEQAITLHYMVDTPDDQPLEAFTVAHWEFGDLQPQDEYMFRPFLLSEHAGADLVLSRRNEVTFISDVATDDRLSEVAAREAKRIGYNAVILIPLRSAGRWQGFLSVRWPETHPITKEEAFIWNQLREPLAAIIASRRSYTAQQQTLSEVQVLYDVSTRLNAAVTLEDTLLAAAGPAIELEALRAALWTFEVDENREPVWQELAALWERDPQQETPGEVRFRVSDFPLSDLWLANREEPLLIGSVANDVRLTTESKTRLQELGVGSTVYLPLALGQRLVGLVNILWRGQRVFTEVDQQQYRSLGAQAAAVVESRLLFQEAEARADELALINRIAQEVSQYLDLDLMLEKVYEEVKQAIDTDSFNVGFFNAKNNMMTFPIMYEDGRRLTQEPITLLPESNSYKVIQTGEPLLRLLTPAEIEQINQTAGLVIGNRDAAHSTASLVFVPLRTGQRIVGVMSVQSYAHNAYTQSDLTLLTGIGNYVAIALENVRLFAETQAKAAQLQHLSRIETELSQATDEGEILQVLAGVTHTTHSVTLQYIDTDDTGAPTVLHTVSQWYKGRVLHESPVYNQAISIQDIPISRHWIENPSTPMIIEDIATDERIDQHTLDTAIALQVVSSVTMPLRSGGRWQGTIFFSWPEPREFDEEERFLFQQLLESVAAAVASRRSLLETEALYNATADINSAQSYDEILTAIRQHTIAGKNSNVITMAFFDRPWTTNTKPEFIDIASRWTIDPLPNLPSRYPFAELPFTDRFLKRDEATLIEDIATYPYADDAIRELYSRAKATSVVFVPLVAGVQWVGYINVLYGNQVNFSDDDVRRFMSLAGQVATAAQGLRLLQSATARARREQLLREISAEVRRVPNVESVMKTAVSELGRALGRRATIYLENEKDNGVDEDVA